MSAPTALLVFRTFAFLPSILEVRDSIHATSCR